ncbi:MAG: hypothetical protein K2Q18_04925 [Bdellovibrionales bacterium]|nr:hypothetical protein [Bdellovibrionales bacterium]
MSSKYFKCFLVFVFLISKTLYAAMPIGSCIRDPNALSLQNEWKRYQELKQKKAKINISVMAKKMLMDTESMRLLQAISEVEYLMVILDELETKFLKKSFVDTRFNDMISSPDFIVKLETKKMDEEIKNSELPFKNDAYFYELLEKVRAEVKKPEIKDALILFRTYDLGILEKNYRTSARQALKLIRKKGATPEIVRSWIKDPPFLRNIALPSAALGPFAIRYRELLVKSVANFILTRSVELPEAKHKFPKITQKEVDEMNLLSPPIEKNSFDEYISNINDTETAAIDGVARTLWGEATSCQIQGLAQFEAIGRIIADRSLAVCRAIEEEKGLQNKNVEVREKNWLTFLDNWSGIKRPAPGMKNKAYLKLRGLSDFGRKENSKIHCAAQVISKKNQFSVWNSYSLKKYLTGQVHKNIPNVQYEIQGPQAVNDDQALIRILCPEFQNAEQKKIWSMAVSFASEIVKKPEGLIKRISWPKNEEVYFYTHEAPLPFAKEVKIDNVIVNGNKLMVKVKGKGVCNQFRLFIPKSKNLY